MTLEDLGWNAEWAREFAIFRETGWQPARLIRDNKITYGALLGDGREVEAVMSGKIFHTAQTEADLPAVGDWVALEVGAAGHETMIRARLPRQTCLSRKMSGRSTEEQVIAANVDVVVVVTEAGADFNLRRMERYFAIIGRSGARPVVLLNKSDLFPTAENRAAADAIQALQPAAEVHITCAEKGKSLQVLRKYLQRGVTVTLIGSSGVGKSSIINYLLGDEFQWTDEVNAATGKGRHTTTARELMVLRGGGILIDNPGIREVHMWTDETTLRDRFADIEALAAQCKFGDCKHGTDAGCAVRAAVAAGTLDEGRLRGFLTLDIEIEKLRANRKKREMTVRRRERRDQQAKDDRFAHRRHSSAGAEE